MKITHIDPNKFQPWVVIDNHISDENYWIHTFEDENENAVLQILVHPDIDGEDVYEAFYDIAIKKYGWQRIGGFSTIDQDHRNNAPLYIVEPE